MCRTDPYRDLVSERAKEIAAEEANFAAKVRLLVEMVSREWVNDPMSERFISALQELEEFVGAEEQ